MILRNKITGIEGKFVREFTNRFGDSIEVETSEGREYFAPKHEWEAIDLWKKIEIEGIDSIHLKAQKDAFISIFGVNKLP